MNILKKYCSIHTIIKTNIYENKQSEMFEIQEY